MSVLHLEPESRESHDARSRPEGSGGIGDYPLRRVPPVPGGPPLEVPIAAPRPEPPRRRRPLARVLRWGGSLFLLLGLLGAGYCVWFYGEGRVSQAYQSWRFDQIVQHRATSVKAFVDDYLARVPVVGAKLRKSPAVSNAIADLWQFDQAVQRDAASLKALVAGYLDRIPAVHSRWHGSSAVSGPPGPQPSENAPGAPPLAPRASLAEGTLIGRLQVPRLGLSTIVLEGDSDPVLREAVGHIPSTSLPGQTGNVAIAGHRDTFFRGLKDVRKNDRIVLVTTTRTYRYRVQSVQVVRPDDTKVLTPSNHATLTLVTCYPFYFVGSAPRRYIVRADEIGSDALADQTPSPRQASLPAPAMSSEVKVAYQARPHDPARITADRSQRRSRIHGASSRRSARSGGTSGTSAHKRRLASRRLSTEDASPNAADVQEQTGRVPNAAHRLAAWLRSLPKRASGNN